MLVRRPAVHILMSVAAVLTTVGLTVADAHAANGAMKELMKKMGAAAASEDAKALGPLFVETKKMKPADPEYANWDAILDKGKAAAEAGDLAGAKASCKSCHTAYRDGFKTKYGSKAP